MKSLLLAASLALLLSACTTTNGPSGATKPYPKTTCVVSGNALGSMGPVVTKVYQGQEVKFCCQPCVKKFDANPAKYLEKL